MGVDSKSDASFKLLGNLAVEKKIITAEQLELALKAQTESDNQIGEILVEKGWVTRSQLKVLLDIHSLKLYYEEDIKFGRLLVVNDFAKSEQIENALQSQTEENRGKKIGEILIKNGVIKEQHRDAILKSQARLNQNRDVEDAFVSCPGCLKEYALKDPERYRKIRCRNCGVVFEVGIRAESIIIDENIHRFTEEDFDNKKIEPEPARKDSRMASTAKLTEFMSIHKVESNVQLEEISPIFNEKKASGKYIFGKEIARGGMGAILDTRDSDLRRNVVTKVLIKNNDRDAITKFIEEAQITGQLEHPNIVPVHDIGVNEFGQAYFTMKKVKGETLLHIIERLKKEDEVYLAKFHVEELIEIFLKVCDSIAFAHRKGVIHCDLKPENIMVGEYGEVMTMDWGLAKVKGMRRSQDNYESLTEIVETDRLAMNRGKTVNGTIAGTPEYMSPEQARGDVDDITYLSDIYSLGGMLFTILAHKLPVDDKNIRKVLMRVVNGDVNPMPEHVAPELKAIVKKAMSVVPSERYQSVVDLKEDLIKYLRGYSVSAKEDNLGEVFLKTIRRNLILTSIFTVGFLFFLGFMAILYRNYNENQVLIQNYQRLLGQFDKTSKAREKDRASSAPVILEQGLQLIKKDQISQGYKKILEAESFNPHLENIQYFKGVTAIFLKEYFVAYETLKSFTSKNLDVEPKYDVEKILKYLNSIIMNGENTHDLLFVSLYLSNTELGYLTPKLTVLIESLYDQYLSRIYKIHPKVQVEINKRTGFLSVSLAGIDEIMALPGLGDVPIASINLSQTSVKNLENMNTFFLKSLVVDDCPIEKFEHLGKYKQMTYFSAAGTNIKSIEFLNGINLEVLNLANTNVSDIKAVGTMPLRELNISGCPLKSMEGIEKLKLRKLFVGSSVSFMVNEMSSQVADNPTAIIMDEKEAPQKSSSATGQFEFIQKMPLVELHLYQTNLENIDFLKGSKIQILNIESTSVLDLSPLTRLPLTHLSIPATCLDDSKNREIINQLNLSGISVKGQFEENKKIGKIKEMQTVKIASVTLTDLTGLPFSAINVLDLSECPSLNNLKGVHSLEGLETLVLPESVLDYSDIVKVKTLKYVVTPEFGEQSARTFFKFIEK